MEGFPIPSLSVLLQVLSPAPILPNAHAEGRRLLRTPCPEEDLAATFVL